MNTNLVYGAFITIGMVAASFALGYCIQGNQQQQLQDKLRDVSLYCNLYAFDRAMASDGAVGLAYVNGDVFCVYTKDRTITEILNTCGHEFYHNQGMRDPENQTWNITGEEIEQYQ